LFVLPIAADAAVERNSTSRMSQYHIAVVVDSLRKESFNRPLNVHRSGMSAGDKAG